MLNKLKVSKAKYDLASVSYVNEAIDYLKDYSLLYYNVCKILAIEFTPNKVIAYVRYSAKENYFYLGINPAIWKNLDIETRVFILIHEVYHIICKHCEVGVLKLQDYQTNIVNPKGHEITPEIMMGLMNRAQDIHINHAIARQYSKLKTSKSGNLLGKEVIIDRKQNKFLDKLCWVENHFPDKNVSEYLTSEEYLEMLVEDYEPNNGEGEDGEDGDGDGDPSKVVIRIGGGGGKNGKPLSEEMMDKILNGEVEVEVEFDPNGVTDEHDVSNLDESSEFDIPERVNDDKLSQKMKDVLDKIIADAEVKDFNSLAGSLILDKESKLKFKRARVRMQSIRTFQSFLTKLRRDLRRKPNVQRRLTWAEEPKRIHIKNCALRGSKRLPSMVANAIVLFIDVSPSCEMLIPYFKDLWDNVPQELEVFAYAFGSTVEKLKDKSSDYQEQWGTAFHILEEQVVADFGEKYPKNIVVLTDGCGTDINPRVPESWNWVMPAGFHTSEGNIPKESKIVYIDILGKEEKVDGN